MELSYMKGMIPRGTGLTGFVSKIGEHRHCKSAEEIASSISLQDSLMCAEGIIAVGDICNGGSTFDVKQKSGIYYHSFIELFGTSDIFEKDVVAAGLRIGEQASEKGLRWSLTPHSTYSVPDSLFRGIVTADTDKSPLSVHFMESRDEYDLYRNEGAMAARFRNIGFSPDFLHYGSPARRLVASVPKEIPLTLIHNTFVTEEDIEMLESHFDNITWVVCPRSNDYIEGVASPLNLLNSMGVNVAIGTDSLASNDSLSIADEIRYILQRGISFETAVKWATFGGTKALGINDWAGSFSEGKCPGVVLADNFNCDNIKRLL